MIEGLVALSVIVAVGFTLVVFKHNKLATVVEDKSSNDIVRDSAIADLTQKLDTLQEQLETVLQKTENVKAWQDQQKLAQKIRR